MSWLKILIYFAVAAAISTQLYFEVDRRAADVEVDQAISVPFLEAVPERIDRLRLDRPEFSAEFRRGEDGRWMTVTPENLDIPLEVLEAVLDTLTSIPPIQTVAEAIGKDGAFGLNPPRTRLRLDQGGDHVATLAFGERNPTRTAVYAKKSGEEKVYLLGLNSLYYLDLVAEKVVRALEDANPDPAPPAEENLAVPGVQESQADDVPPAAKIDGDLAESVPDQGSVARMDEDHAAPPVKLPAAPDSEPDPAPTAGAVEGE